MLLYAIVKSERASKGQGGNERLDTIYTIGETRKPFMEVRMTVRGGRVLVQVRDYETDSVSERKLVLADYVEKGEKRKAETLDD